MQHGIVGTPASPSLFGIPPLKGYSRDLLDVCFGDQLAGSMNLCIGVGTRFRLDSPV